MDKLSLNEIRMQFLSFFEEKGHLAKPSFSLIPQGDNSLLLINSGMAPMKPWFTGAEAPPARRMATCQKCIRTGDIDNVGKTARHHTFFEMLGNFSFGDYFKSECIPWAWEFLTKRLNMPESKLYISIYQDDDEAFDIWHKGVGVEPSRIFRMGKEDNFWEHGLGPCGPSSEIYFDRGKEYGDDDFMQSVTSGQDRYIEVWNLVFTQFDKQQDGEYKPLKQTNIDTGMGLERMAMVMQGVGSVYEVDTTKAVINAVLKLANSSYGEDAKADVSIRVIADHARSVCFMIADGVLPSNEGRGYVLRRLCRRSVRHGKLLGIEGNFFSDIILSVIDNFAHAYPELRDKREHIIKTVDREEAGFNERLAAGMQLLRTNIAALKEAGNTVLSGQEAFRLYDTFGFPLELTIELLEEEGLTADISAFNTEMDNQRQRAREASAFSGGFTKDSNAFASIAPTEFVGYTKLELNDATILAVEHNGDMVSVALDRTPVYSQSGGQQADIGTITTPTGELHITDCVKEGGRHIHVCRIAYGDVTAGQSVAVVVDKAARQAISRNHTATHLLHMALQKVLGGHVQQAGSLVSDTRLRFDFSHTGAMTADELDKVEGLVNDAILRGLPVSIDEMPFDKARAMGAMALFGEKYGDVVRVVNIANESIELCGGTHMTNTSLLGSFKIVSEGGIASGVRRIEAVCGVGALAYNSGVNSTLDIIATKLKTQRDNVVTRVDQLLDEQRELKQELNRLKKQGVKAAFDNILANVKVLGQVNIAYGIVDGLTTEHLKNLSADLSSKLDNAAIILINKTDKDALMLVAATEAAVKLGINCGNVIKAAAPIAGGKGGGRPNMAQAGLKDINKLDAAITAAIDHIGGIIE